VDESSSIDPNSRLEHQELPLHRILSRDLSLLSFSPKTIVVSLESPTAD
jgi:hypothetical protein